MEGWIQRKCWIAALLHQFGRACRIVALRSGADLRTFDAREVSATPGDWELLTVIAGETEGVTGISLKLVCNLGKNFCQPDVSS